jgi:glycosyltransferase involved in cell wall biosynthesis
MKKLIIRSRQNVFRHETNLLVSSYGFEEINNGLTSKGIKTPVELVLFFLKDTLFILKNVPKISNTDVLIVTGFNALTVKLLIRLGIIKYKQLLWFGFFIHTDKAFKLFRFLLKFLQVRNEKIVLNAWYEIPLYAKRLGLNENKLTCMPLGDWEPNELNDPAYQPPLRDYYFAGGFTNRDYDSLLEVFKNRKENLIIVGSKLNSALNVKDFPDNILVMKDIDKTEFESLVAQAKVCILPMKDPDAGASGHMVLLSYMRHKKTILASNFPAIREYVVHHDSALLYDKPTEDIPDLMDKINAAPEDARCLGNRAYEAYSQKFTREALRKRLMEIVESSLSDSTWKNQAS